jgi:tetratricopeptide (TPR) repeat protein
MRPRAHPTAILTTLLIGAALIATGPTHADVALADAWVARGDLLAAGKDYPGAVAAYQTALRAEPRYMPALLGIGQARLFHSAFAGAIQAFRDALAVNPREVRAVRGIAAAQMGLKQYPQAIETWKQALHLAPNDAEGCVRLGGCYLLLKRPAEALPYLERACTIAPENADACYHLGRAYLLLNNPSLAASALAKAVGLRAQFYDAERLLLPLHLKSGLYLAAQILAQDILVKQPTDRDALAGLARCYEGLGLAFDAAKVYLDLANASPPAEAIALCFRAADIGEHEGERELTRRALEKATQLDPSNPALYERLARSYEAAGDRPTALRYLQRAAAAAPAEPEYLVKYARALEATGDTSGALAAYHRALAKQPGNVTALLAAARLCELKGWYDQAQVHWVHAIAAKPSDREMRLAHVRVLELLGRRAEALAEVAELLRAQFDAGLAIRAADLAAPLGLTQYAERMLRIVAAPTPSSSEALRRQSLAARVRLAELLTDTGRSDEARALAERTVREHPTDPGPRVALAHALLKQMQYTPAAEVLRPAFEGDKTGEVVAQSLAEALLGADKTSEAIEVLRAALPHHPESRRLYDLFIAAYERQKDLGKASDFLVGLLADGKADELAAQRIAEICRRQKGGKYASEEMLALAKTHPERPAFGWVAAQTALDVGRPDDAERAYGALAENPACTDRALVALCQVRLDTGQYPAACDAAIRLVGRRPGGARAAAILTELKVSHDRLPAAAEPIRALVVALPDSAEYHCALVDLYASLRRMTEVEALYAAECALSPGAPGIIAGRLRTLQLTHQPEAILARVAAEGSPGALPARARAIYAEALAVSGRQEEAKELLRGLSDGGQPTPQNALRLAVLAAGEGDFDAALVWHVRALSGGDANGQAEKAIPALVAGGQITVDEALAGLSDVWNAGRQDLARRTAEALAANAAIKAAADVWLKWHGE